MNQVATKKRLRVVGYRYYPAVGGAENLARRLIAEIADRMEIDVVTLATHNRSDWLGLLVDGDHAADQRYEVDGRSVLALGRWPAAVRARLRLLAPFYHLPGGPVPSWMGRILAHPLRSVPEGVDVVHNVFMGREAFSLGLLEASQAAGRPFVFTPLRHQRPFGWSSPAFRRLYRESSAVIALTEDEAAWLVRHGAPQSAVSVIGAGPLNDPWAAPEPAREVVGDGKIVLFLGQLHTYKGFRVLLEAAKQLRSRSDLRFVFAGPDVRGHARAFRDAGPNVLYLRSIDDRLRNSLLAASTVVCVPSARESFGLVLVEAWNCKKPVIGGPAAATRELIDNGIDGWSAPQDSQVLARLISELVDNEALAEQMGRRGYEKVQQRFSWRAVADAHLSLYSRLLQ